MQGQSGSNNSFPDTSCCNHGSYSNNLGLVWLDDRTFLDSVGQSTSGMNSLDAVPQNIDLNVAYEGNGGGIGQDMGVSLSLHPFQPSQPSGSGSSSDGQRLSGKRKTPEETSGEVPGRNLSSTHQAENSDWQATPIPDNLQQCLDVHLFLLSLLQIEAMYCRFLSPNIAGGYEQRSSEYINQSMSKSAATVRNVLAASAFDPTAILSLFRQGVLMMRAKRHNFVAPPISPRMQPQVAAEGRAIMVSELSAPPGFSQRNIAEGAQNGLTAGVQLSSAHPRFLSQNIAEGYEQRSSEYANQSTSRSAATLLQFPLGYSLKLPMKGEPEWYLRFPESWDFYARLTPCNTRLAFCKVMYVLDGMILDGSGFYEEPEEDQCGICQDEYLDGQELGKLDCGHDFHFDCIKQWVLQKNSCPICKMTALIVEERNH
ncbi:hypothetical protein F0562_006599 [Nyssa sinensis]|uniref:RING-type E3 ubiquitin transferase n=1 Tax=Nyssa sinensis TaxID=561372 RepID=A0A5J5AN03_9ASTE|nr:hypothetical protein F0562_006599 [Nyssa sinensis]